MRMRSNLDFAARSVRVVSTVSAFTVNREEAHYKHNQLTAYKWNRVVLAVGLQPPLFVNQMFAD